jgi:CubicO group peptidase (beta-lactamase class C family)
MKSTTSILPLLVIIIFSCTSPDKAYPPEFEARIKEVENNLCSWVKTGEDDTWNLEEQMKKYNIRGLSIAVVNNYKIEWARGYGYADISGERPVTGKTLFQSASISKSLNSLGILRLVQEGRLDLNADINDYLETWKFPYEETKEHGKLTLTHLLSHTGALTVHGFPGYEKGSPLPSLMQILDGQEPANTAPVRQESQSGEAFRYSGGGTTISQLLLMDVTGMPYDKYMKKYVLNPLGMKSSSYNQPPKGNGKLYSSGYYGNGSEVKGKYHVYPEQAAAGLWTTPTDLCLYIIETQRALRGESSKVLNMETTKLRLTPVKQSSALGCFINGRYFNHDGGNEGFTCTSLGSLDDGKGVVIMTNSENGAILSEIANSVAVVYGWKDFYQPVIKKIVPVDSAILKTYTGTYDLGGQTGKIFRGKGGLVIDVTGDSPWKLNFTSDSDFFLREYRADLRFIIDKENKVTGFTINGNLARKIE